MGFLKMTIRRIGMRRNMIRLNMINLKRYFRSLYISLLVFPLMFLSLTFSLVSSSECQEPDTLIQRLVDEISDSLYTMSVQRLQDFYTRYELSDSIGPAGQWIYEQFIDMGYTDVAFDSFSWTPSVVDTPIVSRNIIVTKAGNREPDSLVILGAHYDSINDFLSFGNPNAPAPGANDNATGVAGVLEIARLLQPYSFEKTIVFACFSGEEVGFGGSSHYSSVLQQQGLPVRFSLIIDMIGYQEIFTMFPVIIDAEMDYLDDALRTAQLALTYSQRLQPQLTFGYFGSDHIILGSQGPAILVIEEVGYLDPIFHTEWDVVDSLSIPYATEILKMALASVADAATFYTVGIESSDHGGSLSIPKDLVLRQNYPNPFNPSTTISFDIPGASLEKQDLNLSIYDLHGRFVRTLINSEVEPGAHKIVWHGKDEKGIQVPSGIYIYSLRTKGEVLNRKMTLLK